jgi:AAA+ ATPase superfamily predicted ATPase
MNNFWDREDEISRIGSFIGKGALGYITGRRRVGKTALLVKACKKWNGIYHQAVEGTVQQQLLHIADEFKERLPLFRNITPKTWNEFFTLLSKEHLPRLLVFDEFPYLVMGDLTLPSVLQKWIDHELPKKKIFLILSGSSQSMLYSQFLKQSSPLYGRAVFHLNLKTLPYKWFCKVLHYRPSDPESFERYSLVGGVPHYWKLMPRGNVIKQAEYLYFQSSSILSEEPKNILHDETVTGTLPKAILDLIGRGVTKPSELASRLGVVQGNLSRPLAILLKLGLIHRELPFGESSRTTKKVLYFIHDPAISFYYGTYLVFREKWANFSFKEKKNIITLHASKQWENFCRELYQGSSRYWGNDIEIDLVTRQKNERYLIAECKWKNLSHEEEKSLIEDLRSRFSKTTLAKKLEKVDFCILSKNSLPN